MPQPREVNVVAKSIDISLKGYKKVADKIKGMNVKSEKVVQKTMNDFKSRAPAWITKAVTATYGIPAKEVKAALTNVEKGKGVGTIKVAGFNVDNVRLVYTGRLLTPTHFKMRPKVRPAKGRKYTITAEIFKGQRKKLSGNAFLATNRGTGQIPFQRTGPKAYPIQSIKTVSIPQMIENEKVAAQIQLNIEEGLTKRLENHLKQAMK